MSLPWIMIDHILSSQDPALIECILYLFDLYNDAADYSLKRFKKQFLYNEVEAEVTLCFDQFIYKFSEAVFMHYKQLAARLFFVLFSAIYGKCVKFSMLLDKGFKSDCARLGITIRTPVAVRYEVLLRQRHFQVLFNFPDTMESSAIKPEKY